LHIKAFNDSFTWFEDDLLIQNSADSPYFDCISQANFLFSAENINACNFKLGFSYKVQSQLKMWNLKILRMIWP